MMITLEGVTLYGAKKYQTRIILEDLILHGVEKQLYMILKGVNSRY